MPKKVLRFQSPEEFQDFFAQLASKEIPDFQAVEGAGGDMGFDGLSKHTAYQVYYPEEKNQTSANFKKKIDKDLKKVIKAQKKIKVKVEKWIFVIPVDLRVEVIAYLENKEEEMGIRCEYWGATKLTALVSKYPYIRSSFPSIFIPPLEERIKDVQRSVDTLQASKAPNSLIEIITDEEYKQKKRAIRESYKSKVDNFVKAYGTSSSAHIQASNVFKKKADKKLEELRLKKKASDRAYGLELQELEDHFSSLIERKQKELIQKGIFTSGIGKKQLNKIKIQKKRAIEKLNLKYGKK